jgi:hypothetical protein
VDEYGLEYVAPLARLLRQVGFGLLTLNDFSTAQVDAPTFYDPSNDSIGVTGDLSKYSFVYQDGDFATTLVFVAL